ncbi:MAG: DEAD/DEAH box helicase family protein [Christensenellaceae bacterium]|nr:DEAD/DEAH box helicase family protein [Christensenellaceae bacterium]
MEENAEYLKALFYGGNGMTTGEKSISAWYAEDGIHLAKGNTARYSATAQVISWQDAAERIGQLLEDGQYATNVELAEAHGHERDLIASALWNLCGDLSEEARKQGYLSCLREYRKGGYLKSTAILSEALKDLEFRQTLSGEYADFLTAYSRDRSLMRFHYHKPQKIWNSLQDLSLPRREFSTDITEIPEIKQFITEDEINEALAGESNYSGGEGRIYDFFHEPHTPKEQAEFLKKEYGIGGHSHALSRATGSNESHDGKGICYSKRDCPDVKLNWNQVVKRIDELIRKGRYMTSEAIAKHEAEKDAKQQEPVQESSVVMEYNGIKHYHRDDIVLYQVGDFFEMYGEDAKIAAEALDLHLASCSIPDVGRVAMCGIPAHALAQYVEQLRDNYDVTIAALEPKSGTGKVYSLLSIDHEAERDIDAYEAEFGADGYRVFRDETRQEQPTLREQFEQYKLSVGNALVADTAYVNACQNSDRENAYIEGAAAIQRIVTESGDLQLTKLYFDMPTFYNRLHQELLEETYPALATTVTPSPYKVTQADIDASLREWNGNIESKRAVVRYMKEHEREKDTAAWLAQEYSMGDAALPLKISVGNSEPAVLPWAKVQRRIAQLIKADDFLTEQEQLIGTRDYSFEYQLLDRLRSDCEYFLGAGQRSEKHLWAGNVRSQIEKMRELYDTLPEKPEWLTSEAINSYAERMAPPYLVVAYHHFENGFDAKLDYQTLEEAEKAAQGYVDGTMESDGFAYDGAAIYNQQEQKYLRIYGDYPDEAAMAQVKVPELTAQQGQETSVFKTPDGKAYRAGDTFIAGIGSNAVYAVINRVDDDSLWYTFPDMPEQAPAQIRRVHFETHLDDGMISIVEPEQEITEAQTSIEPIPSAEIVPSIAEYDPLASPYKVGDTVYLEDKLFEITEVGDFNVQLRDPTMYYPIFRSEGKAWFERLLQQDDRNGGITEFLPAELDITDTDLQDVLTGEGGLLDARDKEIISKWFRNGEGNKKISHRMSETYAGTVETMTLLSGEEADFRATTVGLEIELQDKFNTKLSFKWDEIVPVLRAMYQQERDGFYHEPVSREPITLEGVPSYKVGDTVVVPYPDRDIKGTIGYIGDIDVRIDTGPYSWSHQTINREMFEDYIRRDERNAHLFVPEVRETEQPQITTEPVAFYSGEKNNLPYDIVVERLRVDEQEHDPPAQTVSADREPDLEEVLNGNPVSVRIDGEWRTFPNTAAAEEAMYEESKAEIRRNAQNFHITDDNLGVGGAKAKYQANINAIKLLKHLEADGRQAIPEQQEVLSRYVGWGGLADDFDPTKENWRNEYAELKELLTPEEYEAARASTLNAHYTSPTVIKAIYEAVGNMGFRTGNILEPSMGVGNFFGLIPEEMQNSRLYGVELDSITGRIAQQLYPKADINVAGFETTDRRDFFDLAIGNVPFGQYQVNDRAYNKLGFSIHDYFFAKSLDQVRPGGVVAFVTSRYTMDKQSPEVRKYIAERAELLGAIRLPNNAFKANAGTDVVSDIIFLQKRDRPIDIEPDWVHLGQNEDGFAINSYFIDHPEMILGRQTSESTQYGRQDFTVAPTPGLELADQLHDAVKYIHGTYQEAELPELGEGEEIDTSIPADPNVKNYSYTVVDGEVYYRENSRMVKPELNTTAAERIKGMVQLRNCVSELIDLQMDEYCPASAIREKQTELNRLYDAFAAKYGLLNDRANRLAFSDDSSYYLLCSLEVLDDDGKLKRKADMFHKRTIKQQNRIETVDTASEALAVSIGEKACVDLGFMASLMGGSEKIPQIVEDLKGVIYKDPTTGAFDLGAGGTNWQRGWQTADEYLSGNVRRNLRIAQKAAEHDSFFAGNVDALTAAQPKDLDASEIEVRLGATWIDRKYIQQFMYETFDTPRYLRRSIEVSYVPYTAEWQISNKNSIRYNDVAAYTTYGTDRANAYRLLEDALNLRDIRIYDTVEDADGRERRVLNAKETTLAAQKQQLIKDAFKDWIFKDPERRETLVRQYNEEMNSTRPREYDGSHIVFSGMNPEITLREHQKNASAHVLYGGNTLLAHEVGAGKTFEMVAAAMESKRLGLCQKSIFVVPNHLTDQWAAEFLRLYPSANILVTTKKDFETRNRKKFCARIATVDYDAVIIGHSQFERIPISSERQEQLLRQQIEEITDGIQDVKESGGNSFTIKSLERTKKGLEARLRKLADSRKDDVITFEQLGVDRMFVDESDNYKNLFLYTKMRNVAGLSATDAQKSSDMFAKCRYMDELTGRRGVVFATGTPVSNYMTGLYTIQRYLQHDRLQEMGMGHFDCWASRFGETTTALELAPEGTGYRARTRFAKFFNLPELMNMFKEIADIKTADQLHLPTPEVEYHTYASKPTEIQQEMVKALSERATKVHSGQVKPEVDNMMKITSDGRKLGLDQRIINPMLPDEETTKVNQCVTNILQYWRNGEADKLTQLVFCDISTPKTTPSQRAAKAAPGNLDSQEIRALENAIPLDDEKDDSSFTVYEDVRQKLIAGGMPPEQIAFIHDANTEVKKRELFAKVRSGQVRVLMGSTAKMGAGTNVQDRLIALHDLDCPWRPRDLTQRKGRIERQGNQNETVHVCRYVTEGTFDAYLWETVENKQKFISQIMTSKSPVRSCEDVDETALSFAEIKALCAGDPRIKERMDLNVEVAKLKIMKADHQSKQFRLEDNLLKYFPEQIEQNNGFIRGLQSDMQTLAAHPLPVEGFIGMEIRGDKLTDKENAGAALLDACKEVKSRDPVQIGHYRSFTMSVCFDAFENKHVLTLKGEMTQRVELGTDARGNLVRIENALEKMPERLRNVQDQLENLYNQQAAAKAEVGKPFPQERELAEKTARLIELDMELNLDGKRQAQPEQAIAKSARSSVLDKLKTPPVHGTPDKTHKNEMEVR